jgi:transcriptional regulator with XRE-family HTH domain
MNQGARQRLAKLVQKARGSKSQRAFARDMGLSFTAVRSWENCESVPSTDNLRKIADATGYGSVDELLDYLNGRVNPVDMGTVLSSVRQMGLLEIAQLIVISGEQLKVLGQADTRI